MYSLNAVFKSKGIVAQRFVISSAVTMLLLVAGCSNDLPDQSEQGDELALATRIEREASNERVNSLAQAATWNNNSGSLQINGFSDDGFNRNSPISITNAATGQFVGVVRFDDENDNKLVLNNVASIPCSVRVQVGGQVQIIPVQNAPANCTGITVTPTGFGISVLDANWRVSTNRLTVQGSGAAPRQLVSVFDSINGQLLGTDQADPIGNWKIKARNLLIAPCVVTVVSGSQTVQANVQNSPSNCVNIPGTTPGVINGFNQAPDGVIIGPIADMAVNVGSSINFMATGFDPDSSANLSYRWSFDGAAPDSLQQNQNMVFTTPGVYRVTLYVTDNLGAIDPTPDTRVIVVQPNIFNNQAPTGMIASPATNVEISAGQSVNFSGSGFDPEGTQLRYVWNFAGGAANSTQATPGNVIFGTPGVYLVSLTVVDAAGMSDPTPEVRAVTVRGGNTGIPGSPNNNPTNQAPNGEIISPATNVNIAIGQTLSFMGTGFDPDSNGVGLRYRWDFGTLTSVPAQVLTQLNPGPIVFNVPGTYTITFTVTDALGMVDPTPSKRIITVGSNTGGVGGIAGNQAPNALISLPITDQRIFVGQTVTFSGSGFDPENNVPLTYSWDFDGAAAPSSMQNPGAITFSQAGTYDVTLTVTDSLGSRDLTPDIRTIIVSNSGSGGVQNPGANFANQDPESQINTPASDLIISVGDSVDFTGFGTDPENNNPLVYSWNFDGAAPNMYVQNPGRVVFNKAGSYRVRLAVIDSNGNVDRTAAERMVTVRDPFIPNSEPNGTITSPATSMTLNVGESVNFSGLAIDPDGNNLLTYEWDFSGASASSNQQSPGSVQFTKSGIYKVTLYVKDNLGFYDSTPDVRFITVNSGVNNINQAPEATIVSPVTDLEINVGDSVSFVGAGKDLDNFGANLTYMWNFGGALPNSSLAAPGVIRFSVPGTYNVSLTVMDNFGQSDLSPATRTITVRDNSSSNRAPNVAIVSPAQQQSVLSIGQKLSFSASATDPDSDPVKYEWNFDGAAPDSLLQNPNNILFASAGTYKVTVAAIDSRGLRSVPASTVITVQGSSIVSSSAPESTIVSPSSNTVTVAVGDTINFQGSATDADNNQPLTYRWNFNGAAASSYSLTPGNVTFNKVGVYQVQFSAADSTGATDPTPATRTITVVAQGGLGQVPGSVIGQSPVVTMTSPVNLVTNINVGGSVNFAANVVDGDNSIPFTYRWAFGNGGIPDQFVQNPGNVFFTQPGTYLVTLVVTDSQGNIGTASKTVVVGNGVTTGSTSSNAPNGIINAPATEVTVSRGQTVYFSGDAIDLDQDTNITYLWNFNGGATNSTLKIPGNVTFGSAGRYVVTLTVTDSTGRIDQTPASVVITVLP